MKHNTRKLLAVILALAMLLSFACVAEDGMTELGMDQPIEIEGEVGTDGETQDPEGGDDLDLDLDLDGEALETGEEELAPETEAAMNAGEDGKSAATAYTIDSWDTLVDRLGDSPDFKREGENDKNPTYYKLKTDVTPSGNSNDIYSAASIVVASGRHVVLDLNGKTINRGLTSAKANGHAIQVEGDLTITGNGTIKGGNVGSTHGGGVYVVGGTFTMEGGTISGNKASDDVGGGGVGVDESGTFTMEGGTISGNNAGMGGGVYVVGKSVFNMTGGTIGGDKEADRNTASKGGGVRVDSDGTFNMSGGTISGNAASAEGGGVYMRSSSDNMICKFTMSGGTINGNTATKGGGVHVDRNSEFTMNDGTVSGNNANSGGGVYMSSGTFTMSGGAISNNTADSYGGGMYKSLPLGGEGGICEANDG